MEYELLFFTSVANAERAPEIKKEIEEILTSLGAKIAKDFSDIGKRKFAHPIKKQTHGFYSFCWFSLEESENIPEINKRLNLNDSIMRHLIVRASEIGRPITAQSVIERKTETGISKKTERAEEKPRETRSKVGIGELDEKLSEILGENPE